MAITIPNTNDSTYYAANGDHGFYQFLTLAEITKTFVATYVGAGKICESVRDSDVYFHATRALQEFSYDVLRSVNTQEIVVPNTLSMLMPRNFVSHVKLTWSDASGVEHIIYPARVTSNPLKVGQDANLDYTFTTNVLDTSEASTTNSNFSTLTPSNNQSDYDDETHQDTSGSRYGIDPQHSQVNGSYFMDYPAGKIYFSSNIAGKTVILEYISDGLDAGDDDTGSNDTSFGKAIVHKFAEEAMYKHIAYGCLLAMKDTSPNLLMMLKKERFAETRKAKLRLSNIKIEEITQVLRGASKFIKH